jgi:hypothetical protein
LNADYITIDSGFQSENSMTLIWQKPSLVCREHNKSGITLKGLMQKVITSGCIQPICQPVKRGLMGHERDAEILCRQHNNAETKSFQKSQRALENHKP